jgi:hypothetical protein
MDYQCLFQTQKSDKMTDLKVRRMKEIGVCELCPESFRGKIEDNERREARDEKRENSK